MPVICEQLRLAYFPVPKVACTSVKSMFFRINNRADFARFKADGRGVGIHDIPGYKGPAYKPHFRKRYAAYERIAVVRDPLQRLVSAYRSKVVRGNLIERDEAARRACAAEGLPSEPDLGGFLLNVAFYAAVSQQVGHHVAPHTNFLGDDMGFYHHVFRIEDVSALADLVSARLGRPEALPHENASQAREDGAISADARAAALRFCAPDYALLEAYYPMPVEAGAKTAAAPARENAGAI